MRRGHRDVAVENETSIAGILRLGNQGVYQRPADVLAAKFGSHIEAFELAGVGVVTLKRDAAGLLAIYVAWRGIGLPVETPSVRN